MVKNSWLAGLRADCDVNFKYIMNINIQLFRITHLVYYTDLVSELIVIVNFE